MPITHTQDQRKALEILGSQARYIELRGGARSGKTVTIIETILARALAAKRSKHLIARFRGNSLGSIFGPTGTFFWVLENAFPAEVAQRMTHNGKMGYYLLPNGSEVWYGGLDDPKRVDKLLGNEYADIYINEGSQVPYGSFTTVLTRLAQNAPRDDGNGNLRQKCYVDDNPPPETHWLARLFQKKQDPETRRPLVSPTDYQTFLMNPEGNKENLDPTFLKSLQELPERQRKRFYEGKNGDAGEAALWTSELLDQQRVLDGSKLPKMIRKVVAVDPSGADDVEDTTADEIGIGVVGLGIDGKGYVLEDLTMRGSPGEWGKVATDALERHEADCIVAESNFGGAMVKFVIQTAKPGVAYREVTASVGKHIRAEPVAGLFEADMARLVGRFPDLEDELCLVGGTLIETSRGQVPIEQIRPGDTVMTRDGYAPVKAAGQTGVSVSLVQVCIQGSTIEATPCHPIFVQGKFVSARNVRPLDRLLVSRRWVETARRSLGEDIGIIGWSLGISSTLRAICSIAESTQRTVARYLTNGISITSMAIPEITASKTLKLSAMPSITGDMSLADGKSPQHTNRASPARRSGGRTPNHAHLPASNAGKREQPSLSGNSYTAASSVRSVRSIDVRAPVFNLEIEDGYLPEYFANGILVHNCAMTTAGYTGTKSPNRLDWMVWGFTELFPKIIAQAKRENEGGIAMPRAPRVNLGYANAKRGRGRR